MAFFQRFDHLFTFGSNIGTAASPMPTGEFTWHKTWQPVTLDDWQTDARRRAIASRRVMTWQIESFTDVGGNKDQEFIKFIDLPSRTTQPFELAINGPQTLLREHGWDTVDAMRVSRTPWDYRDFIHTSKAEFGVAKHTYVASRSGWFSDRTECYLASGRPALVQDTGWTAHLPHGDGLLAFSTPDEAAGRHRPHQQRLPAPRPRGRRRSRASTSTRAACFRACWKRPARDWCLPNVQILVRRQKKFWMVKRTKKLPPAWLEPLKIVCKYPTCSRAFTTVNWRPGPTAVHVAR